MLLSASILCLLMAAGMGFPFASPSAIPSILFLVIGGLFFAMGINELGHVIFPHSSKQWFASAAGFFFLIFITGLVAVLAVGLRFYLVSAGMKASSPSVAHFFAVIASELAFVALINWRSSERGRPIRRPAVRKTQRSCSSDYFPSREEINKTHLSKRRSRIKSARSKNHLKKE